MIESMLEQQEYLSGMACDVLDEHRVELDALIKQIPDEL